MSEAQAPRVPVDIAVSRADHTLTLSYADGTVHVLPAELLRVYSPSAEVQGHSPDQRQVVGGRRHVGIMDLEPMGHYALRIVFDDLHESGIYRWDYLWDLGCHREAYWEGYLADLAKAGKRRDP
ncbi:DUF971 domain-containing protein [uncultured Rhodospira sp.]|uniref:DUF971 domain-containing protein n=1 Tax=uncultured Rhodospira sp. TaxID=1936189 RepID=UPI00261AA8A5|nr:DUF971 domain-containing protein [uncultured Rhodospira sp.]